jgi:predicted transcriptional regulator
MISIRTKPENRLEIIRALDIYLAEKGMSRTQYAVRVLGISPATLHQILHGKQRPASHPAAVQKINELTGADMAAWEK